MTDDKSKVFGGIGGDVIKKLSSHLDIVEEINEDVKEIKKVIVVKSRIINVVVK